MSDDSAGDPDGSSTSGARIGRDEYVRLLDIARDKSTQARGKLLRSLTDLFYGEHTVLSEQERDLMNDILRRLVHEVEQPVRKLLAERLARADGVPRDLVVALANDEIDVAHQVLVHSNALRDMDLIEVVQHRTKQHRLAITMRAELSEAVSEAIVEIGETDVIQSLLENTNARISKATMEYLVEEAKSVDTFQNPLIHRPDLPGEMAERLYWCVSAALRHHILQNFDIDPMVLDDQLETAVFDLIERGREDRGSVNKARDLARQLSRSGAITPAMLIQVLRQGEVTLFEAIFSEFLNLRLKLTRRLLYERGGEGLAIACKAAAMEKPAFTSLFLLCQRAERGGDHVDAEELSRTITFFEDLDIEASKKLLHRWRRDPGFLQAMWQVEAQEGDSPLSAR